ncbi:MAG: hypothetical protein RJA10_327, partial [Pseudomonadota bacterium]
MSATPLPSASQAAAPAASLAPLAAEDFFGPTDMSQPQLSPSGRYLSYLRHTQNGHNVLVALDLQDLKLSKALAGYADADIFNVRWVNDDFLVFSLTDLSAAAGELDFAPGLYGVSRSEGTPRQLVKLQHDHRIVEGPLRGPDRRLHPNHRLLFVPQDGSPDVIVAELSRGAGELTVERPLRLNVETLQAHAVDSDAPDNVNQWLFDANGQPRVAVTEADGRVRVHWRKSGTQAWQLIQDVER